VRLYIMRHGPAEDRAASGKDFDRALTAPGRERVRDVARALREGGEEPHAIVSSPLVRALQTAEIVAAAVKLADRGGVVETRRELAPEGDALGLVKQLVAAGAKRVMLVGHEPDLADLAAHLGGRDFRAGLQKAMVVGLSTQPEAAERGRETGQVDHAGADLALALPMRVRFVLDPKSLEWLDDAR
jgi:phosphohistidine phosphatase